MFHRPSLVRAALMPVLCGALLCGCRSDGPATPDRPRLAAGVAMRDATFRSAALGREMPYRVFLPASVVAGRKLPVVYLLHGNGGGFRDWSNYSDVAQYAARGLVLVMPEGGSLYYENAVGRPRDRYEDYLIHDLPGDVEARFPARGDRSGRAIVGVSMGGFAAIRQALSHPEEYVFAGAISPPVDLPERGFRWQRAGQWWGARVIFGPMGSAERRARDPFLLVQKVKPEETPYLYLTAGEEEPLLEPDRRFAERLRARGFRYEFHTLPGGHDWGEWDAQIPGCFGKLLATLERSVP